MKRIAWLTDIHLNFAKAPTADEFLRQVADSDASAVLIGGDIAEARDLIAHLEQIDNHLQRPVFFVLGNHDFYFGSIQQVRAQVQTLCRERPTMNYLSQLGVVELTPQTALVGHDGWADTRLGDYQHSYVMMNDYRLITELAPYDKASRRPVLMAMGDEAANHIRQVLPLALDSYAHVFLLTHVPPLREACWHEGQISDDEWAPHFTCQAMGTAILDIAKQYPQRTLTVLCGHTHGAGETRPLPNVRIITGGAEYGRPAITKIFELD